MLVIHYSNGQKRQRNMNTDALSCSFSDYPKASAFSETNNNLWGIVVRQISRLYLLFISNLP